MASLVLLLFLIAFVYVICTGMVHWLRETFGNTKRTDTERKNVESDNHLIEKLVEYTLENATDAHRASKDFVLSQVIKKGRLLEYASEHLKNDKEVVLKAVESDGSALKFASQKLREDKQVVLAAVSNSGIALQYASEQLKDEKEVVLAAVGNDGYWYDWETHEIEVLRYKKDSHSIVLSHVSDRLKSDREVVLKAVRNDRMALEYADAHIKEDAKFILQLLEEDLITGHDVKWRCSALLSDYDFAHKAVQLDIFIFSELPAEFKSDEKIVLAALSKSTICLSGNPLFKDKEFLLKAVGVNETSLKLAPEEMFFDEKFQVEVSKVSPAAAKFIEKLNSDDQFEYARFLNHYQWQKKTKTNMTYLFFDTETTGLPRNRKAPASDTQNWPRLVQLGWIRFDSSGAELGRGNHIIKPDGFIIPVESSNVHGKTHEYAMQNGEDLNGVLSQFQRLVSESSELVAHNMSFDEKVVGAEFYRAKMANIIADKVRKCTMESSTDYCAIEGPYGYKWPSLSDLHIKLFGVDFEGAHDAMADIEATAKCFWELRKRGIL